MTNAEKQRIIELRNNGMGYGAIAKELGLSKNTISTFCRRLNVEITGEPKLNKCKHCGNELINLPKHRAKVFCSDKCRLAWWKAHPEELKQKNIKKCSCEYCNKEFSYYGRRTRKYCSRECYLNALMKAGVQDD